MTATTYDRPVRKRSRIPLIFFAFFGVVLAVNSTMIYIALDSWTGLETKNHYLKGVDYNDTLDRVAAQEALGWTVESSVTPAGGAGRFAVTIQLKDADGAPMSGARVIAEFERPTHHGADVSTELVEVFPGSYVGTVTLTLAGEWNLRRLVWRGEDTHQTIERFHLAPEHFE